MLITRLSRFVATALGAGLTGFFIMEGLFALLGPDPAVAVGGIILCFLTGSAIGTIAAPWIYNGD